MTIKLALKKLVRIAINAARKLIAFPKKIILNLKVWPIYIQYLLSKDKKKFYFQLSFEEVRRLSEFRNGLLAPEISRFLEENPEYNSRFQEWWFSKGSPEGKFDLSLKMYQALNRVISNNKKIKTFIDLGCNSGEVVYEISKLGIEAVGIDLPLVVSKITLPIKSMALDLNWEFPSGTYDIIFCRETFEHVSNPDKFLEGCRQIAHPGTLLFLSCPYTIRHFHGNAFHLRILSQEQLATTLSKHGFEITEMFADRESNVVIAKSAKP